MFNDKNKNYDDDNNNCGDYFVFLREKQEDLR